MFAYDAFANGGWYRGIGGSIGDTGLGYSSGDDAYSVLWLNDVSIPTVRRGHSCFHSDYYQAIDV